MVITEKNGQAKSTVLLICEHCSSAMFKEKILRERTAATNELITIFHVTLVLSK